MRSSAFLQVAKRYGTPVYVYDQSVIEQRARELRKSFPTASFFYATKANNNPAILKVIREEGIGIETVSTGELRLAHAAGFTPTETSFTCSNLTLEELRYAARARARVHLDSLTQLELWGKHKLGREVSLRLNQGIGAGSHSHIITGGPNSKFGIDIKDLPRAKQIAQQYGLSITGIEQHIGSNILNATTFRKAIRVLLETAAQFPDLKHMDFGGGFGVPYRPDQERLDLAALGAEFTKLTAGFEKKVGRTISYSFEPGRYLVAEAGTLLVSVVDRKSTSKHTFVGVNSGFNHLIRPAMYDAYHEIENVSRTTGSRESVSIAGNICESGDVFASDRKIVAPRIGDVLAIRNAGAYGMSMASIYNLRRLPKEILVTKGKARDISFKRTSFL